MSITTLPLRKASVVHRNLGEESVLYDTENRVAHVINRTAEFVWTRCDGATDIATIAAELRRDYPDAQADFEADVAQVLAQFRAAGLLEQ